MCDQCTKLSKIALTILHLVPTVYFDYYHDETYRIVDKQNQVTKPKKKRTRSKKKVQHGFSRKGFDTQTLSDLFDQSAFKKQK